MGLKYDAMVIYILLNIFIHNSVKKKKKNLLRVHKYIPIVMLFAELGRSPESTGLLAANDKATKSLAARRHIESGGDKLQCGPTAH